MAEVITLSDDDDVIPIAPPRQTMVLKNNQVANSQATAHISTVTKLSLEELGFKTLTDVIQRNQAIRKTTGTLAEGLALISRPAPLQRSTLNPVPRPLKRFRPSPSVDNYNPTPSTSTQRTRHTQNAIRSSLYNGHYMFESTESYEPSRRSTRFNTKKIDGKFVCSYNPSKCYKLCSSTMEVINHAWSHVINDLPPGIEPKPAPKGSGLIYTHGAETILSMSSQRTLKKMQTCEFCNAVFHTVYLKQQHVIKCHIEQDSVDSVCNICELDFQTAVGLQTHMQKHISGEAPYHCRKCKYRTSVRSFLYQHFVDKHSNDALMCPICLFQEDLRPSTRRTKHIFVRSFMEHMRRHSLDPQFRCRACALSFNESFELSEHRTTDHTMLNQLWQTTERRRVHDTTRTRLSKRSKISILQKKFFETLEGRRIVDEVACRGDEERCGFDLTSTGNTLFQCECGFKSYNGNRTASHFHRCRRAIQDIERDRELGRAEEDPEDELKLFSVFPPEHSTEIERKRRQEELRKSLNLGKEDTTFKLRTEEIEYEPIDDLLMLKMISYKNDPSGAIVEACVANVVSNDE